MKFKKYNVAIAYLSKAIKFLENSPDKLLKTQDERGADLNPNTFVRNTHG